MQKECMWEIRLEYAQGLTMIYVKSCSRDNEFNYDEEPIVQSYDILSQDLLRAFYGRLLQTRRLFTDKQ